MGLTLMSPQTRRQREWSHKWNGTAMIQVCDGVQCH
jgi:hypothetical protein